MIFLLDTLWLFGLFGVVVGFTGLLFNLSLMNTLEALDKLTSTQ